MFSLQAICCRSCPAGCMSWVAAPCQCQLASLALSQPASMLCPASFLAMLWRFTTLQETPWLTSMLEVCIHTASDAASAQRHIRRHIGTFLGWLPVSQMT